MPTITVKNIPTKLHRALKVKALQNGRSLNSEILECMKTAVFSRTIDHQALVSEIQKVRFEPLVPLSNRELSQLKAAGRP